MGYWMIMRFSRDLTQTTMTFFSGLKKETWSVWEWLGSPSRQSGTNCSNCSGTKVSYLCVLFGLRYVSRYLLIISSKKDHFIQISWTQDAFIESLLAPSSGDLIHVKQWPAVMEFISRREVFFLRAGNRLFLPAIHQNVTGYHDQNIIEIMLRTSALAFLFMHPSKTSSSQPLPRFPSILLAVNWNFPSSFETSTVWRPRWHVSW